MNLNNEYCVSIYPKISEEVGRMIKALKEDVNNEEFSEFCNYTISVLNKEQEELERILTSLKNNSEWEKYTIAFYGETNAGKSTLIETLRIILGEELKVNEREHFQQSKIVYDKVVENINDTEFMLSAIRDEIKSIERDFSEVLRKKEVELNELEEKLVDYDIKIFETNQNINVLKRNIIYLFKYIFLQTPEKKEIKIYEKSRNELEDLKISIESHIKDIAKEKETRTNEQLEKINLLTNSKDLYLKELEIQKSILESCEDGKIIGDGKSDFTRVVTSYDLEYEDNKFTLLDLPGIEGNEKIVIDEITNAIEKAHVVFYISSKNAPPQKGDEGKEGTIEKISKHLSSQTEVYFIFNKRITNPISFKSDILKESDQLSLNAVDEAMENVLGENYKGNFVLSARPAFLSIANLINDSNLKEQNKFLNKYSNEVLLNKSLLLDYSNWLQDDLIKNKDKKIIKSNYKKIKVCIDNVINVIRKITVSATDLRVRSERDLSSVLDIIDAAEKNLYKKIESKSEKEINEFKNEVREKVYKEIDCYISSSDFKEIYTDILNESKNQLESNIRNTYDCCVSSFQNEVEEEVNRYFKYLFDNIQFMDESVNFKVELINFFSLRNIIGIDSTIKKYFIEVITLIGILLAETICISALILSIVGLISSVVIDVINLFDKKKRANKQKKVVNDKLDGLIKELKGNNKKMLEKTKKEIQPKVVEIKNKLKTTLISIDKMIQISNSAALELSNIRTNIEKEEKIYYGDN